MSNRRIVDAHVEVPDGFDDSFVEVVLEGSGKWEILFTFYSDEISFRKEELIGLTEAEARVLKFEKDKAYLAS